MAKRDEAMKVIRSAVFSEMAKLSHKKSPRPREFYVEMAKKRHRKS